MLITTISDRASGGVDARSLDAVAFLQGLARIFRRHVNRVLGGFAYLWVIEAGEQGGRGATYRARAFPSGERYKRVPLLTRFGGDAPGFATSQQSMRACRMLRRRACEDC
jgi:hypothetical protein